MHRARDPARRAERARDRIAGLGFAALGTVPRSGSRSRRTGRSSCSAACSPRSARRAALAVSSALVPWLCPLAALACVPVRIGVHVGGASSKLLVPLYVVILGATILFALAARRGRRARARARARRVAARGVRRRGPALSLAWSKDVQRGRDRAARVLHPVHARSRSRSRGCRGAGSAFARCTRSSTVMAIVFAVVGFYQYETRDIFQNPKVIYANAYAPFFRVNSVFWDPSVYGRFLVVAMVPSIVLIVRGRSLRWSLVAAGGARRDVARPPDLVLAVELRRAARRRDRRGVRRLALAGARRGRARASPCSPGSRSRSRRCGDRCSTTPRTA